MTVPRQVILAQRRASDPGANVWVSASAGSGKTKVLADRVLRLLLRGTRAERILCLTFTRAAAAEMANRINRELGLWAASGKDAVTRALTDLTGTPPEDAEIMRARRLFGEVLDAPGGIKIMTIHAFCESVLRRFPLEARVAPHFEVMDERTSVETLLAAREEVFEQAHVVTNSPLSAALAHTSAWLGEYGFAELMGEFVHWRPRLMRLFEQPEFAAGGAAMIADRLGVPRGLTEAAVIAQFGTIDDVATQRLRRVADALLQGSTNDAKRGRKIADWLADPNGRSDRFEAYAGAFVTYAQDHIWRVQNQLVTKATAAAAPFVADTLDREAMRVLAAIEQRNAAGLVDSTAAALQLAWALMKTYDAHKARQAMLDYDDLILSVRALLENSGAAWVLYKLDGGIDHILIDEAQDTNPDQWAVVRSIADEFFDGARARTAFAVGDAKQSIFSFQRASPKEFHASGRRFESQAVAAGTRWDDVALDASFRSTEAVLRAVDATFASPAARDGLGQDSIQHVLTREGEAGLVELWPLTPAEKAQPPDPWRPEGTRDVIHRPDYWLAWAIATRIDDWLKRGEQLESRGRPIRAGDIMVLVRRRTRFVEALVGALKSLGVDVAGVDRMVLTDQLAIMDLVALGHFLLLPEDDLTLAAVLKSPLIGLDEDDLFVLAHGRTGRLWHELRRRSGEPRFQAAHDALAALLARTDQVPPFELYSEILGPRDGRERLLARLGIEANDPIDEFLARAFEYERVHPPSLQGFLQWLSASKLEVKRDLEHGARDEVRIMTVHGAKGLQAPIVFLADTTQVPLQSPRLLWSERDGVLPVPLWPPQRDRQETVALSARADANLERDREQRRLLYVAMTRAADRLYVCGWANGRQLPEGCWYELIRRGLEPVAERVEFDIAARGSSGWQGNGLRLTSPQVAQAPRGEGEALPPRAPALPAWARAAAPVEPIPTRPLMPSRPSEAEPPVFSPLADGGGDYQRGLLIHRLLELLPDLPADARRGAMRRHLSGANRALPIEEQEQIAAEVSAVLDVPELATLFGPRSRAEVPIVGTVNGHVVSGRIDRLVVDGGEVKIVDYKTNRPMPADAHAVPGAYLRQLALYHALLAKIYPKLTITAGILWTAGPRLMWITDDLLSGALLDHARVEN